jgi:FixJ family two-component response regulator
MSGPDPHSGTATVYVVDDDASMRDALTLSLTSAGYRVLCFSGPEGLLRQGPLDVPAVILLDVRLNGQSGVDAHARMHSLGLRTPVVYMSGQSRADEIVRGFRQGALHFLLKPFASADLLNAVREGLAHDQSRQRRESRAARLHQRLALLTPREREVCRLMVRGLPNREIAALNGTAAGTVKLQRASVLEKLQVEAMSELAALFQGEDVDAVFASLG